MSLIYIFAGAVGVWLGGYYGFKGIRKSILDQLNERFVSIREKADAFDLHNEKIIEKSQELTRLKAEVLEIKEKEERQINLKEVKLKELKDKNNPTTKDLQAQEKLEKEIKDHKELLKNIDNAEEIQAVEKELEDLNKKSKHLAKIDLFDLAPVEKYFLSKHALKLIEKARKNAEKGLGAIEIHNEVGSKLYFRKYAKIMVIDGKTYFHNPAKVKGSWYGVPCEHFDEGDPEAKDMGNTMFYPMGGNELTALIYDQKIPDQDKKGFELNRLVLYGVMAVVMIAYLVYIFTKDPAQATTVVQTVAQNATEIVR